jgi:hypothetical protein
LHKQLKICRFKQDSNSKVIMNKKNYDKRDYKKISRRWLERGEI